MWDAWGQQRKEQEEADHKAEHKRLSTLETTFNARLNKMQAELDVLAKTVAELKGVELKDTASDVKHTAKSVADVNHHDSVSDNPCDLRYCSTVCADRIIQRNLRRLRFEICQLNATNECTNPRMRQRWDIAESDSAPYVAYLKRVIPDLHRGADTDLNIDATLTPNPQNSCWLFSNGKLCMVFRNKQHLELIGME